MRFNPVSYERSIALITNYWHLKKMCKEEFIIFSEDELLKSARWNYKEFGFGYVSLGLYLEYKKEKNSKRLYNSDVKLRYKLLNTIFERDNYTCSYCGQIGGKLEGDHIIPQSKGGTNDLYNLTTSCRRCNRQKKDKSVEEFNTWKSKIREVING